MQNSNRCLTKSKKSQARYFQGGWRIKSFSRQIGVENTLF